MREQYLLVFVRATWHSQPEQSIDIFPLHYAQKHIYDSSTFLAEENYATYYTNEILRPGTDTRFVFYLSPNFLKCMSYKIHIEYLVQGLSLYKESSLTVDGKKKWPHYMNR